MMLVVYMRQAGRGTVALTFQTLCIHFYANRTAKHVWSTALAARMHVRKSVISEKIAASNVTNSTSPHTAPQSHFCHSCTVHVDFTPRALQTQLEYSSDPLLLSVLGVRKRVHPPLY